MKVKGSSKRDAGEAADTRQDAEHKAENHTDGQEHQALGLDEL